MENIDLKNIEKSFNVSWQRIVNILSEVFNTEIALINHVEDLELEILKINENENNLFKENEIYDLTSVYCEKTVNDEKMLEINNATKIKRWEGYLAIDHGLISYLGYPIFNPQGKVVGTICVEDKKERNFKETEKNLLLQFKEVIESQLQQIYLTKILEDNFEKGRKLHDKFLPNKIPEFEDLTIATYYSPAERIGGDFYNFIEFDNYLLFYISDVSGHDLSGSMLNIFLKEAIDSYLISKNIPENEDLLNPAKILKYINKRYGEETFPDDYFISLIIGVMDLRSKKIQYSNAGIHTPPLLIKGNEGISSFRCGGMPISYLSFSEYDVCSFKLEPGDIFFLNTDGLIEQSKSSSNEEFYGQDRLIDLLYKKKDLKPNEIIENIYLDFNEFKGDMIVQDDLTYLLFKNDNIQ